MPSPRRPELRVLYVSHSFPPEHQPPAVGGMQRVAVELHETLQHVPGVSLRSLVLRTSGFGMHVSIVPFILSLLWRVPREARAHDADVIVFSSMVTALLAWPLQGILRRAGVKTAAIVHGLDATNTFPTYQWLVRRSLRALDVVLPVSRSTAALCVARGAAADKVEVVPNGVSLRRFYPDAPVRGAASGDGCGHPLAKIDPLADQDAAREELARRFDAPELLDERTTLVCSVGRQIQRKGFDWFTREVLPLLPDDVHYWLAGDGPQAEAIREAAEAAGVTGRLRLLGTVDEETLTTLLRAADLFAMPNRPTRNDPEGFGVVMLEAGLCGTPTVAAALEGIRDVIADGMNGHLVASGDAASFAATIQRYHYDARGLAALAHRTLGYTSDTFDWSSVATLYAQVLSANALAPEAARVLRPVFESARPSLSIAAEPPVLVPAATGAP